MGGRTTHRIVQPKVAEVRIGDLGQVGRASGYRGLVRRRGSRQPVTAGFAVGGRRAGRRAGPQTVIVRVSVTGAVAEPCSKDTRTVRMCRPGPKSRVSGVVLRWST